MAAPRLRQMGAGLALYVQRRDGSEFPVDIMLSPICKILELLPNGAGLLLRASNTAKLFCLACSFECPRPVLVENPTIATHLYRIAQEGIGNAIKHAQSKSIVVSLKQSDGELTLTIKDNGHGFTQPSAAT
jgi:signal transduction histidine kinase